MTTVKIGNQEIEITTMPIIITAEKIFSQKIIIFHLNNQTYEGYVSDKGRLVVNKGIEK